LRKSKALPTAKRCWGGIKRPRKGEQKEKKSSAPEKATGKNMGVHKKHTPKRKKKTVLCKGAKIKPTHPGVAFRS